MPDFDESARLAEQILNACIAENLDTVGVGLLHVLEHGHTRGCVVVWADTYLTIAGSSPLLGPDPDPTPMAYINADTGRISENIDDLRPATRWAIRVFKAREAGDRDTFDALLNTVEDLPPDQVIYHLGEMLSITTVLAHLGGINGVAVEVAGLN